MKRHETIFEVYIHNFLCCSEAATSVNELAHLERSTAASTRLEVSSLFPWRNIHRLLRHKTGLLQSWRFWLRSRFNCLRSAIKCPLREPRAKAQLSLPAPRPGGGGGHRQGEPTAPRSGDEGQIVRPVPASPIGSGPVYLVD